MDAAKLIAEVMAVFAIIATLLPFIRTDQWWIRMFDFPRVQVLFFGLVSLVIFFSIFSMKSTFDHVLIGGLAIAIIIQGWHIYPYTPIAGVQVKKSKNGEESIRLFIANVLQDNEQHEKLLQLIRRADPDIILLNEMNDRWIGRMQSLCDDYKYAVLHPQENTYGMALYSRLKLAGAHVRNLIDPDVPSIRTEVLSRDGRMIRFYGVHPRPPGIKDSDRSERQDSDQRDAELVVLAKEAVNAEGPLIIAGDFNDVAWSHTTRVFQRISRLLDPRVGRGFYNSFNAKNIFFRFPLDHLFHSDHFTLVSLERMGNFGSDHFPICIALKLEPRAEHEQEAPEKKEGDEREAEKMIGRANGG